MKTVLSLRLQRVIKLCPLRAAVNIGSVPTTLLSQFIKVLTEIRFAPPYLPLVIPKTWLYRLFAPTQFDDLSQLSVVAALLQSIPG
jgi:hypothetical protein